MTIEDRRAADAVLRLLETLRNTGSKSGRVEVLVENGKPTTVRIVKASESVALQD